MILERLFGASLESPTFSLQDQMALDILGGPPSDAGIRVNSATANTYSPWYRGINLVSRDVAKLPLYTYERIEDGEEDTTDGKRAYLEHPSYPVLRRKANKFQTAFQFKLQLTSHAMATGNGYGYIVRAADGSVMPIDEGGGIWTLDPNCTTPVRETITNLDSGALASSRMWYVTTIDGVQRKLDGDDILHIRGMGFDGLVGYDVVKLASGAIGRGLAQQKFANTFYKNGAHLKVVLESPTTLTPKQASDILGSWDRIQGGLDNAHRTAILHSGLKANQLAATARESQFIEGEEFVIRFVANFLGIPPHKLGAKTGESYASKEQENLDYLNSCLDFWLTAWEDECWDKLLTEREKKEESAHIEFSREKFQELDLTSKANYCRTGLGGQPWLKVNEARSMFNMNPVEGGNEIKSPLNMGGADNQPKPPEPIPEKKSDKPMEDDTADDGEDMAAKAELTAAAKLNLEESTRRMVRRIGNAAERAAKNPLTFNDWIEEITANHGKTIEDAMRPAATMAGIITGKQSPEYGKSLTIELVAALLEFSGRVTVKTLAAELPAEMARLETSAPANAVRYFFGDVSVTHREFEAAKNGLTININVPEQKQVTVAAPAVTVQPPAVTVTVPEQKAPVVNVSPAAVTVNVPEQAAPVVNVENKIESKATKRTATKSKDGTWTIEDQ